MPQVRRDQEHVRDIAHQRQRLYFEAAKYTTANRDLLETFNDAKLWAMLPYMAAAQARMRRAFAAEAAHIDLTRGQHPVMAISGASHPQGDCRNIVGSNGDRVNAALILRSPDSTITGPDGKLTDTAASFAQLAKLKGIPYLAHARTAYSTFLTAAYFAHKFGDLHERHYRGNPPMLKFIQNPAVRRYIDGKQSLYEKVLGKGFEYYEDLICYDEDERKNLKHLFEVRSHTNRRETEDSRFIRAMQIQQTMDDYVALSESGVAPEHVIAIYQGNITGLMHLWNPEIGRFVSVPDFDPDSASYERACEVFLSRIPQAEAWQKAGPQFWEGARVRRQMMAIEESGVLNEIRLPNPLVVACSDSRALPAFIIDTGAAEAQIVMRNPGAFVSQGGQLSEESHLSLANAELLGESAILSPHGNCGAETLIAQHYADEQVPGAFKKLAENRVRLMRAVWNKGDTPSPDMSLEALKNRFDDGEICDYYSKLSGIPMKGIPDCMALQQLLWDMDVVKRDYPDLHRVPVYQQMGDSTNYVFNESTGKFVPIPSLPEENVENDQKPNSRRAGIPTGRIASCAC